VHEFFTKEMTHAELEWESLMWHEFVEATCLYIAASYCQENVVQWLLDSGVSPTTRCYCNQIPLDVVGQCHYDAATAKKVRGLLKRPPEVPKPPMAPSCNVKMGTEEMQRKVVEEFDPGPGLPVQTRAKTITEPVQRARVVVQYKTYWLPPGTNFEIRYRLREDEDWTLTQTRSTSKTIHSLLPENVYVFAVRAQNDTGWSEFSQAVEVPT